MNKYQKYFLRLAFMAMTILFMQACYKDKGNYDYHDINVITFNDETVKSLYSLNIGDPLVITPEIESSIPGSGDYTYEWVRHGLGQTTDGNTNSIIRISTGKDLDYIFPATIPAGRYSIYLRVTDNNTKVQWYSKRITVILENVIKTGILMMCEIDGEANLDMLNYDRSNTKTFTQMKISELLGDSYPEFGKPISIHCFTDYSSPYPSCPVELRYAVLLHTETGLYRLLHSDLSYDTKYDYDKMIIGDQPAGLKIKKVKNFDFANALVACVTHDDIKDRPLAEGGPDDYLFQWQSGVSYFMSCLLPINRELTTLKPVRVSEVFGQYMNNVNVTNIFYDLNKGRYCFNFSNSGVIYTVAYYGKIGDTPAFDFTATNTNCEPVAILARSGDSKPRVYVIHKDNDAQTLSLISFSALNGEVYFNKNIKNLPDIGSANDFYLSISTSASYTNFLYYSTDQKIYLYNMSDGTYGDVTPPEIATKVAAGAKISFIKSINNTDFVSKLMVFTYDPSEPKETCGSAYVCTMNLPNGNLSIANSGLPNEEVPMVWENMFGKVVSAAWKDK